MFKKEITFTDYNGQKRTETFHFNLNKAELLEMNLSTRGGLESYIERITNEQDHVKLVAIFKELVLKSYGKKSDDGFSFDKSPDIVRRFEQSEAYSELFTELATNSQAAAEFFNKVVPHDFGEGTPAIVAK